MVVEYKIGFKSLFIIIYDVIAGEPPKPPVTFGWVYKYFIKSDHSTQRKQKSIPSVQLL